ncbi:MAG: alpha/beta fold hydrolase [Myxococcota bacterium]|nr:alpha/beta fold hydrolase [Myxococcota bacterium]
MPSLTGISAAIGGAMLAAIRIAQRRKLAVRRREHRDRRGRITPYLELGHARRGTLVWLHGFSDRPDTFLRAAASLHRDYRIVAPALPGFHEGWLDPSARHTFGAYAEWLAEVVADLGGDRFHVMGNSLGGAIALALATRMPERVISVAPVNNAGVRLTDVRCIASELEAGANLFEVRTEQDYARFVERIFAGPVKVPRPIADHLFRELRGRADWYARVMGELVQTERIVDDPRWSEYVDLRNVRVPALVIWGEHDTLFPLAHGRHIAEMVPGAELHVIERCGHCPHLERPAALARAWADFAARVETQRASA